MPHAARILKRSGQTSDQIYGRLIEAILSGEFPSGSVVREKPLAQRWRVSRTPLREAMRRAAESGFVVLRPNQAPIVRPLTVEDVRSLYNLREVLELHALNLAWPRFCPPRMQSLRALATQARQRRAPAWTARCLAFDLALHDTWKQACGNSWLIADLERHYQFLRIFQSWVARSPEALGKSYDEHLAILDALERHEKAQALARLRQHIRASAQLVEEALRRDGFSTS